MSRVSKIYIGFMLIVIGYFSYATWNGKTFWEDKAKKNTEYTGNSRSHGSYGRRFYHK